MRSKEERIHFKELDKNRRRKTARIHGFAYKWKLLPNTPLDAQIKEVCNPKHYYFTESGKWDSKRIYKNLSARTIRNRYKKDLREKDLDDIGQFNGSAHKLYDYKWSLW